MPLGVEKRERSLLGQLKQRERMPYIHWFRTGRRIQPPQPLKRSSLDELDMKQSTTLTTAFPPPWSQAAKKVDTASASSTNST
jgi:hypothetical protein